jgi:hypothetical protein
MSATNLPGGPAPVTKTGPAVQTPGKPVTPTPPATAPPAAPEAGAELAKLEQARRAIEIKERQHVVERRKFAEERETQKKTLGEKLSRLDALEKREREAQINPEGYLKGVYGEKWFDRIMEAKTNGGVPSAEVLAHEIAKAKEEIRKELTDRDEKSKRSSVEAQRQAEAAARQQLHAEMGDFLKANGKEYPVFKRLGADEHVARLLADRIESEYNRTSRRDETSGKLLAPGKILTTKEAADLLESDILGLAEEAAAHEKYQSKLREKLQPPKPPPPAPGGSPQQRRTLSNDLTGSTPSGSAPAATDAEKREKALAARAAHIAARVNRS